jgi:simple sugar transport system permease protein
MAGLEGFLAAAVVSATPLLYATLGELLAEKSGSLNLGVEGMMLLGAVAGFMAGYNTGSPALAILGAMAAGGGGALVFAALTVSLRANQVVTGLTLTIFGAGAASFLGQPMLGFSAPESVRAFFSKIEAPLLSDIPVLGRPLFSQDVLVYGGYALTALLAVYMYKTKIGLNMRATGENTAAADASGVNVSLYKYCHIVIGGAMCGVGGAYLALVTVPVWQSDVVVGRGWIAVALVIFASWNPVKAMLGALLFGGLGIMGLRMQSMGLNISQHIVDMLPYIATICIVIFGTYKNRKEDMPPACLAAAYFREER